MKTVVTKRGQAVVPAQLRRRYGINSGTVLAWIDTGQGIHVIPLPADIVAALRGAARGERLSLRLQRARRRERHREAKR